MRPKIFALLIAFLCLAIPAFASSTVTASARSYASASSEYHSITHAAQSGLHPTTGSFSVGGWIYSTLIDGNHNNTIIAKDNASNRQFFLMVNGPGNDFRFLCSSDGKNATTKSYSGITPSINTWYFVVAVFDNTNNTIGISVNGNALQTTAFTGDIYNGNAAVTIGAYYLASPLYHTGRLSNVFYYSKALVDAEISALYNSGNGLLYKDLSAAQKTSLTSWWDGAETSGVLRDAHGSNTMTDNNTVTTAAGKVTYTAEDASQFTAANGEYLSADDAAWNTAGAGSIYFAAWVRGDSFSGSTHNTIISKIYSDTDGGYEYRLHVMNTGAFRFQASHSTSSYVAATALSPSTTTWYFVEGYIDATGDVLGICVNRGTDATAAWTYTTNDTAAPFRIGSSSNSGASYQPFNGRIESVACYSALPSTAVRDELYGRGFGIDYSDLSANAKTNLVSWWELTEASGTRNDSIGTNHLTDNNTVTGADGVVYDAPAAGPTGVKSIDGVAVASVKTVDGTAIGSVKVLG